ncbi:efflux RND transporter periplasmic adaptor subunit [Halocynthiibacter sp. C4]|uniref:efflux RND transporter periplasmic adaptor subunit n=1 Tax=Halocynthiibacter sp. C4 TaxID=2992758 RepID=UPI00237BD0C8|nr:efflux RND transporter periplasmic adaptor subunit [Halocynthiibacter sp. C4]MDE0590830.1 efflux RND transporter periplasmic adaptor subunit [Halocynthiibacter sp. C4]
MRFLGRSLTGVFLLAVTLGLLAWGGNTVVSAFQSRNAQSEAQRPAREQVFSANVVDLVAADHTPVFTAYGEVRSRRTLDLRASSAGRVVFVDPAFEEGGRVTAGQLLLRIDPADAEDELRRVEADISEAEAEIRAAELALTLAKDDLNAAIDQADLREVAYNRQTDLKERGVGTDAAVETAALAAASARQAVVSRRQALAQAEARVETANAALARHAITLTEAERRLEETEIRAGFDGTLSGVSVVEGGIVTANEQVAQLIDPKSLEVAFRVSTSEYARLLDGEGNLVGAPVLVGLDVLGLDLQTEGKITRESGAVQTGQSGRVLYAEMADHSGFRPGDFVEVKIDEPELKNVARVPALALNASGEVLVLGPEDRLQSVSVEVLRRQDDEVLIGADGHYGERIVAERSPLLGAGIKVRPLVAGQDQSSEGTNTEGAPPAAEMVTLTDERRAALVAFVESNQRMPQEARERILGQLAQPEVPVNVVDRLEQRMGG